MSHVVFISHASSDRWVAEQIAKHIEATGATYFLDTRDIETGDVFDDVLRTALLSSSELLVLLTPAALQRPYIWTELGAAWMQGHRIVGVLYGVTTNDLTRAHAPAFLRNVHLRDINDLDEYFVEMRGRVSRG